MNTDLKTLRLMICMYQNGPSVASQSTGGFVIVWSSLGQDGFLWGIYAQRFDASGEPLEAEFQVNTYTTGAQTHPGVDSDEFGNFVVAWSSQDQDGDGTGIFAQRFNRRGDRLGTEFQVNTTTANDQRFPAVRWLATADLL